NGLRLLPNATSPNIIGGYSGNYASGGVYGAFIGGGGASGYPNRVYGNYGVISGGYNNQAGYSHDKTYATVGGGYWNDAMGSYSAISGGYFNDAEGDFSTI